MNILNSIIRIILQALKRCFNKTVLEDKENYIEAKNIISAGIWYGSISGFIIGILVILLRREFGFDGIPIMKFKELWPRIIFIATFAGGFAGWLCCRYASLVIKKATLSNYLYEMLIFIYGFILSFFTHQLPSRNALVKESPFGQPDFETLAIGFFVGYSLVMFTKGLKRNKSSKKDNLGIIVRATVVGAALYGFIYMIFAALIGFEIFKKGYAPFGSAAIFVVEFPHPERILYLIIFCLIFGYSFLTLISSHWIFQIKNKSVSNQRFIKLTVTKDDKLCVGLIFPTIYENYTELSIRYHCYEVLLKFAVKKIHDKKVHDDENGGYLNEDEYYAQTYITRITKELKINRKKLFEKKGNEYRISIPAEQIEINRKELEPFPKLRKILKADWCCR
ncbi:MAG: hypothetical protein GF353_10620 [Candidatus Lokiarchaeota archaeon]|nr:hypothetical protein [Candidatus Lokiarchaeota archaeon]